jgi:hypothetical protein
VKKQDREVVATLLKAGRRDLAAKFVQVVTAEKEVKKHPNKNVYVEVTERKYGFDVWIVSKAGQRAAPISIPSSVKTTDEAFKVAFKTIDRLSGK